MQIRLRRETVQSVDGPTITIERATELLHCGRTRVFALIASGEIEAAPKFGRKTTVVTASVVAALSAGPRRRGRKRRAPAHMPPALHPESYGIDGNEWNSGGPWDPRDR